MNSTRAGLALAAVTSLGLSFAAGYALGAHDPSQPKPRPIAAGPDPQPIELVNGDLTTAESCSDLLAWYHKRGTDQVGPYGWGGGMVYAMEDSAMAGDAPTMAAPSPRDGLTKATNSETGTNVQEAGVDEPDIVKTDGDSLLVRIDDDELTTYDVGGGSPDRLATVRLPDLAGGELLLAGDRVVVIGSDSTDEESAGQDYWSGYSQQPDTRVYVLDVSDPEAPEVVHDYLYDSGLVTARQQGDTIRLVVQAGKPDLHFVEPNWWRDEDSAQRRNRGIVEDSTIDDWLPHVSVDGGDPQRVFECSQVALPADDPGSGLGTLGVVGFDIGATDDWSASGIATDSDLVYMSTDRMFLATSPYSSTILDCWDCYGDGSGSSHLYGFDLDGIDTTYASSGEVQGSIRDRWSMDEVDGTLRVAVGPTTETGNFNSIVTLATDDDQLVEIGRVDKLGVGEEIKAVRWFDDVAILVTFRQTDPLFAVDLSRPSHPKRIGTLKIPGYSEYLHPLGADRMIGIGQEADPATGITTGAQAGLFNLSDLTHPRRMSHLAYRKNSIAQAGLDPRQFTWLPEQRTALTVISKGWSGQTGWVSVLQVKGGKLHNRMIEAEYGSDVAAVRLVPLTSGKVALVTGQDVRFLNL